MYVHMCERILDMHRSWTNKLDVLKMELELFERSSLLRGCWDPNSSFHDCIVVCPVDYLLIMRHEWSCTVTVGGLELTMSPRLASNLHVGPDADIMDMGCLTQL